MKERRKKTYIKPEFSTIIIDRNIALVMQTQNEDEPPVVPLTSDGSGTSTTESTEEPLKTNSFEENPFER